MFGSSWLSVEMSRRHKSDVSSWFLMVVFVFSILFNFYVNVWINEPHDSSSQKSKYIWIAERSKTTQAPLDFDDYSDESFRNSTQKHVLDPPVTVRPQTTTTQQPTIVWPNTEHFTNDRIIEQLKFKPESVRDLERSSQVILVKTILLYNGYKDWGVKPGRITFLEQKCPVSACSLTDNRRQGPSADAILFRQDPRFQSYRRPPSQIWILYLLEAPYFTPNLRRFNGHFNWTATYRRDSDIVAPYEKFLKYDSNTLRHRNASKRNYAEGKTKKVAWFVSNCHASNQRLEFAKELGKYIQVDIFGKCGDKQCPRGKDSCSEMLNKDYKFYLAFENSNCRDYITEKFFHTGLQ